VNADKPLKLLFSATVLVFLLCAMAKTKADPDLWGYLAFGRLFWETGKFPYQDVFSYLPTRPLWVYHEWLTGVLFYPLYQKGGAAALQLVKFACGLITLAFIYLTARRRGGDLFSSLIFCFVILGLFSLGYNPVRAQVFTYAFFAVSLYLLESARLSGGYRRLWLLIPLQVLWCNLHGGFLAGLGLIALYGVGEALSRRPVLPYAAVFLAAGLATLINPYGLSYWHYLYEAITMPRPDITEWSSLLGAFRQEMLTLTEFTYVACLVLIALLLAFWARWREVTPILVLGATLVQGLMHVRHLTFFMILAAAYFPSLSRKFLEIWQPSPSLLSRFGKAARIAGIILLTALLLLGVKRFVGRAPLTLKVTGLPQGQELPGLYYPLGGSAHIEAQGLQGKLLTEFSWGEYLIWTLYPRCLVALDGRYETVYPPEVAKRYFAFIYGREGWQKFLQDYPPHLILIDSRKRLCALLRQDPAWQPVYTDSGCALFVRRK